MYHDPDNCVVCNQKDTVGVLQKMWDAWTPAQGMNKTFPDEHYSGLLAEQVAEIEQHLSNDDRIRALYEMVDIISIALNWMRRHGVEHSGAVANLIAERVAKRYEGKTLDIIKRDLPRHWPNTD